MKPAGEVEEQRRLGQAQLFPDGVPALWCPLLTHFRADGAVDDDRILAHLDRVAAWVTGILVPGPTGEGWDLSEAERLRVLGLVLDQATRLKLRVLIALLRRSPGAMFAGLVGTTEWLKARTGETEVLRCLARRRVGGFAVCVPARSRFSEEELERELAAILETGLPIALYQLPNETANEVSAGLAQRLAARFPNLWLFLDGSEAGQVARACPQPPGVFLARALEGDVVTSLRLGGGIYDGVLAGVANCFPKEMRHVLRDLQRNRRGDAQTLSSRLDAVVRTVLAAAQHPAPPGDPTASVVKAIDHFMAHGPRATQVAPPILRGRRPLPAELIRETGEILRREGLMPAQGYLG